MKFSLTSKKSTFFFLKTKKQIIFSSQTITSSNLCQNNIQKYYSPRNQSVNSY